VDVSGVTVVPWRRQAEKKSDGAPKDQLQTDAAGGKEADAAAGPKPAAPAEKFVLDPQFVALFAEEVRPRHCALTVTTTLALTHTRSRSHAHPPSHAHAHPRPRPRPRPHPVPSPSRPHPVPSPSPINTLSIALALALALALTPLAACSNGSQEGGAGRERAPRSLALKYVRVTSVVWSAEEVVSALHEVRSADEEAHIAREAESSRAGKLSLSELYAKPPPVWLHPAFAAEFADAFIAGTAFEEVRAWPRRCLTTAHARAHACTSAARAAFRRTPHPIALPSPSRHVTQGDLHVSIEVLTLALDNLLAEGGLAHTHGLSHGARSALNTVCAQLKDTRRLAHKLSHAQGGQGQERSFFSALAKAFDELEPNGVLLLPYDDGDSPILLAVRRGAVPHTDTCTFTVVNCSQRGSEFHPSDGRSPPKIKYRTCLELGDVPLSRLADEAFWAMLWFGMSIDDPSAVTSGRLKRGALEVLYEVCVPFLASTSLDRGLATWEAACTSRGVPRTRAHTLRRSSSAHYGCCRHALRYLLERSGVGAGEYRVISLLLRLQLFRLAQHDLRFVLGLGDAERVVLSLAKRTLAHKAAKLGAASLLSHAQMASLRREIGALDELVASRARRVDEHAPPPLILSAADAHLGRPSLEHLLGLAAARLEPPHRFPGHGTPSLPALSACRVLRD
jgi:hypothetical protein